MPTDADLQFGRLAIKHKVVSEEKVKECLAILQKAGNGLSLGEVLLRKGYITQKHFAALTRAASKPAAPAKTPADLDRDARQVMTAQEVAAADYSGLAGKPIDAYLEEARRVGASDFHFQVDAPPYFRVHGQIVYLKHPVLSADATQAAVKDFLDEKQWRELSDHMSVDFCYESEHGRYRANVFRQRKGFDSVFRIIPRELPTVESLHLPEVIKKFCDYRHGIVLLTGPAGCGKTATMAALVQIINKSRNDHIVMVEDPIEYLIESEGCNVNQRHVHVHTDSFATALRSAMRADPDYICVGEMRDLETVSMAITAAETGHLVFGTLHTQNATRSVDRIIDVFPPKEQEQIRAMVSESLRGVVSQQLLPRADGRGREPAAEIMFATSAVRNLIRERKTFQLPSVIQTGLKQGMVSMDDAIGDLLRRQVITKETARFHAENPARFD